MVLKPAEDTPASATLMARLAAGGRAAARRAQRRCTGYGPDSAGAALTAHPGVDRITFTGESGTGKTIAGAAAANLVPVSLELGGKGANIVFDDADLDNAVAWSIRAIFSNAGQVCLAGSRLYVQRGIYAEFTDRFVAAAKALVAGDPKDEATQLGPLASEQHYRKVRSLPGRYRGRRRHDQDRRPRRRLGGAAHRGGERPAGRAHLPRGGVRPGGDDRPLRR